MNISKRKRCFVTIFVTGFFFASCAKRILPESKDLRCVDAYIGSGGHGHVFVGASVPFGMVQLGPSNIHKGWDWCSGYHYSDSILIGFSHTHLSGTGGTDLGDILLMPYTGPVRTRRGEQNDISGGYAAKYTHADERVFPGYYSMRIRKYGIKAELTATAHVGLHRYTFSRIPGTFPDAFPDTGEAHIIIDLKEGNGDKAYQTYLKLVDEHTIEGYRYSHGWSADERLYFTLESDAAIAGLDLYEDNQLRTGKELTGTASKGVIIFAAKPGQVILKVGLSPVSCVNARDNIQAEAPGWNFNKVLRLAEKNWDKELGKITVTTKDPAICKVFNTALFHTYIAPNLWNDANRDFRGNDKVVYTNNTFQNYSTFSLWDTYRAASELLTLTQPERVNDMINSMLGMYRQQGKLPIWPLAGSETNLMPGYSAVPVVVDAWMKGFRGFDQELAYEAITKSATFPAQKGVPYVMKYGYIPCDSLREGTSRAMEYAVDDWCIAQMAKKLGKEKDYEYFAERGKYYKKYFDPGIGFIRPKKGDGNWRSPYDPAQADHAVGDFCEGNGWQYTFFAPQDPEGLIDLFHGDKAFTAKLDSLFLTNASLGEHAVPDIAGLIGMYAHGNEPSHHIAYLYAFAGEQWKTAEKVRYIMKHLYTDRTDGLAGNEDCGQMSAWYIFSAMGFYPVNPANGIYVFGSPAIDRVTLNLPGHKKFVVRADGNSEENIYIQAVELNGRKYTKAYISHTDIVKGGTLTFHMGPTPNYSFGASAADRPRSEVF